VIEVLANCSPRSVAEQKEPQADRTRLQRTLEDKGELGLDHFGGRSFPGWHHHVSVVSCYYTFVVATRVRAPSAASTRASRALGIAA
jgi:SRSO17 transposase